ncbi:coiled-coil domain-containing protein 180-like [Hemibagrus wyckioides]|uniref:coiled-coil domain-containing protein 180-like n=1 Tax=Hemibagrus wyckioides TaxID=337641 RepID=UPI00266CB926|nr:coiled-coil domain-containing protein 180-like [Hemibagrus wyckioides]
MEVEEALYPKSLIIELQRNVREKFFNHLEERNQEVLSHTVAIVEAMKEKLKSELDLRIHLHQPRAKRIKMNVYNVRAAELILHEDRVDRHCRGVLQALDELRTDFNNLQVTQREIYENIRAKIDSMEDTLYAATKSDMLLKLSASIQISLDEHFSDIQDLQRQFRENMEIRLGGLREANAQLMKNFKLFAEGGNFTPKEIKQYRKHLEKMADCIDSTEKALMQKMAVTETKCQDEAKKVISKFEEKLQFLKVNVIFHEKIQRILKNTKLQIKSEAMKSNSQKKMINTVMSELKERLDAYTQCSVENRVTSGDICSLVSSLIEEIRKRSQYLDCYLDHSMAVPLPGSPLQGAFATASRSRKQEKVGSPSADPLLQPSRMGAAFMDDKAVEVIRGLLWISKPQTCQEVSEELKETNSAAVAAPVLPSPPPGSGQRSGKNRNLSGLRSLRRKSMNSMSVIKPNRFDTRFQVFGPKPDDQKEIITFKGFISNILWEANDVLLQVAEDFYQKTEHRLVSRPQYIQESFELCAEDLNKILLDFQSQCHKYHHRCVQEFCKQLKAIEEIVCKIPEALLTKLRDQHLDDLSQSLSLIHQQFNQTQQQSEQKRRKHIGQLSVRLSHPACEKELNRLVTAEDNRQEEQRKAIENNRLELQACIKKNADEFVTSLATLTESLLFQLANVLTVDDIQGGSVEPERISITKLVRRTRAGTLQKEHEMISLLGRGSRAWPGISYFGPTDGSSGKQQRQETATIATAKTTMAQLKVMEVRNALHQERMSTEEELSSRCNFLLQKAQLSLSLHEGKRRRRAAHAGCLSEDNPISRNTGTGYHQHPLRSQTGAEQCSEDIMRNQLFSGTKPVLSIDQDDHEEIRGLPDNVVCAKTGSDIIERLMTKKLRENTEALTQLQRDLAELSAGYESLLRDTGEDFLLKLSECDEEVERLMQKTEHDGDLIAFSYQDLHEIWTSVSHESAMRRNCIQELDELIVKYETERAGVISALLRKYTMKLEKICYLMPSDVHRLINNEAMMINQALLANKRAVAKLHLNLMEKDLQKEVQCRLRWETKLQDWKKIKVVAAISQFKDFLNSPEIQNPKNVQDALNTMRTQQKAYSEQRLKILEQVRNMTPPNCSVSLAAEWYSSLSSVNEQIDGTHSETMTKLREYFENTWQDCYLEVEHFKSEVSTYGAASDEIQQFVNSEMVPLIGKFQTQAEERLAAMKKAFEGLAETAAFLSKSMFEFVHGAAKVWELHSARLQRTEQQLQDSLKEVSKDYEEKNQKKEAQLDAMMDKLRQESTEEALKATMEQILNILEQIKEGFVNFYKEGVVRVESYPEMVLKEIHTYSIAVSQYFKVNEIYSQDPEELQILYPALILSASQISCRNNSSPTENIDCFSQENRDSQNNNTFTTLKGNIYSCPEIHCDDAEELLNVMEVEEALYPKSLIIELQRNVREKFFNHLEERNQEVLSHTVAILEAKKEKLKSELDLRIHLHQPRAKRIKMNVYNVRAAELILHEDRVDRHCRGVLQALDELRTDFNNLQVTQREIYENFRAKINSMEDTLYAATKSDMLLKLSASIQFSLDEHFSDIQDLQRQFRQNMEIRLGGLREANAQLMKNFNLFAEGGSFTPKEIEQYRKHLEKMAKRIDSADEALMLDMEGTESKCLEKAKEVISKFEEKLQFLKVDLIFLEKIQGLLTNTQVQIKSEAMKSNSQKKMINTVMSELKERLDAYTQCSVENRVTSGDICSLTSSLIEEIRKRSQYLDCYLDHSMAALPPDALLQGAFAVAARPRSRKQEKVGSPSADPLLQPSRMGAAFMDDKAVEVIRGLLWISKPQTWQEVSEELKETNSSAVAVRPSPPPGSGQRSGKNRNLPGLGSPHRKSAESINSQSVRRLTKPTRFDKRFQVFGPKPDNQKEIITFKGFITNILWEANDLLLQVAEDYYKKKERRSVSRPQYIQESFELCAEDLNKRLLVYQRQTHEYHRGCVQEFCKQLKAIEEIVCKIPEALLTKLRDQHLEDLSQSLSLIHQQFNQTQQQSEQKRRNHIGQLSVRLSHPACEKELNRLVTAEDNRQEEQRKAIENNRLELQACIKKNADEFVTSLATLTESLLFQLANVLTVDDIQGGSVEPERINITKLVHQTRAGTLQKEHEKISLLGRGSRAWPGISYFGPTDGSSGKQQRQETATIATAKTTMAQLKVMEVRNALHQSYEQRIMEEFEIVEKFRQEEEAGLFHWQEHWRGQLKILATIKAE